MIRKIYLLSLALILIVWGFVLYGQYAVYRYPTLTIDPEPRPLSLNSDSGWLIEANGAYLKFGRNNQFRAFQPQVELRFTAMKNTKVTKIQLENIHPLATLEVLGSDREKLQESLKQLTRTIKLSAAKEGDVFSLVWRFPVKSSYRFVAMGDTGGDRELEWNLIRAGQLNSDFILHAGDAYYDIDEVNIAGSRLNQAPVPVYMANGNHDFQGPENNAIDTFLQDIGPMNARFSLLGHCFINLDTGAFMYPPEKGERASLLTAEIINQNTGNSQCIDNIILTHKPVLGKFEADFPQRNHSLYGWDSAPLIKQLKQLKNLSLIAGHIHKDFEFKQEGISTYVVGSGLANQDLLTGKKVARLLVGEISADAPLKTEWVSNGMPMEYHCSNRLYRRFRKNESHLAALIKSSCIRPQSDNPASQ